MLAHRRLVFISHSAQSTAQVEEDCKRAGPNKFPLGSIGDCNNEYAKIIGHAVPYLLGQDAAVGNYGDKKILRDGPFYCNLRPRAALRSEPRSIAYASLRLSVYKGLSSALPRGRKFKG